MSKIALITGASRGIGAAVARRLHADGYIVVINYVNSIEAAQTLAQELDGLTLRADVAHPEQVNAMVAAVLERFGRLDALICNAGVAWQGLTQDMDDLSYRKIMSTDLDGAFHCCRSALPAMIRQKSGRIVLVSSMWGETGGGLRGRLLRRQGGGQRPRQGPGQGGGSLGHHGERGLPRGHRHRHERPPLPGGPARPGRGDSPGPHRPAGGGGRRRQLPVQRRRRLHHRRRPARQRRPGDLTPYGGSPSALNSHQIIIVNYIMSIILL